MKDDERIQFIEPPRDFFAKLLEKATWDELQIDSNVSARTLRAWRSGETSMAAEIAREWVRKYEVELPACTTMFLSEARQKAGTLGGTIRHSLWGNPGTREGRSRGGKNAMEMHKRMSDSVFVSRNTLLPEHSADFAELVGIILGDGTITLYQFILYSNSIDEKEYARFLVTLIERLFGYEPVTVFSQKKNVIRIISSRKRAVTHLLESGLTVGNKVRYQVDVPEWIKKDALYANACLRGLVDTDGCVYLDRHAIKGKNYASLGIAFTNASIPLLDFVENRWKSLGFSPTRSSRDVRLRRKVDVLGHAEMIGFSNPKHARKIKV